MSVPVPGMSAGLFVPATMRIVVVMVMIVLRVAFVVMTAAPRRVVAMIVLFGCGSAQPEFGFHGSMLDTVMARKPQLDRLHRPYASAPSVRQACSVAIFFVPSSDQTCM